MTEEDFIAELGKTEGRWFRIGDRIRRGRTRVFGNIACPITAVCEQVVGLTFHPLDWDIAARLLKLDWDFAQAVVHAADHSIWYKNKLRQAILVATGIQNPN